ncbi:aminoglycoside 6-adenylyltransferase [Lachnospiraceae bacterium PF1-22]|uniref:aminoglycoside 6-adenylyltransferase n=1 Tax=Ohessyouella blattaphilus TaxID=2949333 RepID=UPI003E1F7678
MSADFYTAFEARFVVWAKEREDIRAALIAGSRARRDHHADEYSDLDIMMYTTEPEAYLKREDWLRELGPLLTSVEFKNGGGDLERLSLFEGGYQVDFVVGDVDELRRIAGSGETPDWFHRGVRAVIDKDYLCGTIIPKRFTPPVSYPVSVEAFLQVTDMFWFLCLYLAKQIARGEPWPAKMRDTNAKELLLCVIEWHEKDRCGQDYDTWHMGRFIKEWASPDTLMELNSTFGHFDREDSWRALNATANLFARLSHDIAGTHGFPYPDALEQGVRDWMRRWVPALEGIEQRSVDE